MTGVWQADFEQLVIQMRDEYKSHRMWGKMKDNDHVFFNPCETIHMVASLVHMADSALSDQQMLQFMETSYVEQATARASVQLTNASVPSIVSAYDSAVILDKFTSNVGLPIDADLDVHMSAALLYDIEHHG